MREENRQTLEYDNDEYHKCNKKKPTASSEKRCNQTIINLQNPEVNRK